MSKRKYKTAFQLNTHQPAGIARDRRGQDGVAAVCGHTAICRRANRVSKNKSHQQDGTRWITKRILWTGWGPFLDERSDDVLPPVNGERLICLPRPGNQISLCGINQRSILIRT